MTTPTTLTFTRHLQVSPARVHHALTDPAARMVWGPPDTDSVVVIEDQPTPAEGGRETSRCGPKDNPYVTVQTDWLVLTDDRVAYAETLVAEGAHLGITLATCDLAASSTGTDLTLTLQIVSYVGDEMIAEFEGGWTHAVDNLGAYVTRSP
ncbi:MAG: SRPBCC domain-containing protein [Pseudomonadota bacterium]